MQTHEAFIANVAALGISRLPASEAAMFDGMKLTYGMGPDGVRGVTYYRRWQGPGTSDPTAFVEIGANCQRDWIQVAGTTLHELGHVLAGWQAGHDADWHIACDKLGLHHVLAGGTDYGEEHFEPWLWAALEALEKPADGAPVCQTVNRLGRPITMKPCTAGIGTKGGTSRGAGSGSRLRLFECECVPPVKVRVARDHFDATCNCCHTLFRSPLEAGL